MYNTVGCMEDFTGFISGGYLLSVSSHLDILSLGFNFYLSPGLLNLEGIVLTSLHTQGTVTLTPHYMVNKS